MTAIDWTALRVVSCDDVLGQIRLMLPDATVQAQRNAIERGWDFTVQMPQHGARWFHAELTDGEMEDKGSVERAIVGLVAQVHADAVQA